jgi:hypothetical protein
MKLDEEIENPLFDQLPVFFIKAWAKTIWTRASKGVHLEKSISDFIFRERLDQG